MQTTPSIPSIPPALSSLSATDAQKAEYSRLRREFDAAVRALGVIPMYDYCSGSMYLVRRADTSAVDWDALAAADSRTGEAYDAFVEGNLVESDAPWFTDGLGELGNFARCRPSAFSGAE